MIEEIKYFIQKNTSIEQCAITSLIVNDLFGGKIMRCMSPLGNHYYNLIEGKIIDLIDERFLDEKPKYEDVYWIEENNGSSQE